jgi:hypothetical protein
MNAEVFFDRWRAILRTRVPGAPEIASQMQCRCRGTSRAANDPHWLRPPDECCAIRMRELRIGVVASEKEPS